MGLTATLVQPITAACADAKEQQKNGSLVGPTSSTVALLEGRVIVRGARTLSGHTDAGNRGEKGQKAQKNASLRLCVCLQPENSEEEN